MVRPTLIDMDPVKLKHYPFMISLNKCSGNRNVLSPKIYVPKEIKDMVSIKTEDKAMTEHISYDSKRKFNSTTCNSNQEWNNKTCQCDCINYHKCEKENSWNPRTCICENSKYLKSIANTSATECDANIIAIDYVSTKKANIITIKETKTIATNVTSTASINCHSKKEVRDGHILDTVLLTIILLLIIIIISYYYAKQKVQQKVENKKF